MPTATAFKYHRPFPFCPVQTSPGATFDYVGNLTLAQMMAFWWNIADITFTTAGTSTVGAVTTNAAGTMKFNPPTVTGDFSNSLEFEFPLCAMIFQAAPGTLIGDLPTATRTPRERVCVADTRSFAAVATNGSSIRKIHSFQISFYVRLDPADSAKYAIYYTFFINSGEFTNAVLSFRNPNRGSGSSSGSYVSGTFAIGGHSFNWRCYYNTTQTGADMSASTSTWTY